MNCQSVVRCLDAVLDREVDASAQVEIERHLSACVECAERFRFAEAFRGHLRSAIVAEPAPEAVRARLAAAMLQQGVHSPYELSWRHTWAVAAAALVLFAVGMSVEQRGAAAYARVAPILDDVVQAHVGSFSAEIAQSDAVSEYFNDTVGFAVQPVDFKDSGVRFLGARAARVAGHTAATLRYESQGRPVTVVAFRAPWVLEQLRQRPADEPLFVRVRGHLVPLVERDGVIYAVVGDLSPQDQLAVALRASLR